MGARLSCLPCKKLRKRARKRNRIFPTSEKQENRSSSEILSELQNLGFVQESTKPGGMKFVMEAVDEDSPESRKKVPRRLPKLTSQIKTKDNFPDADAEIENTFYTEDERNLIEEIKRDEGLVDKDDNKEKLVEIRRTGALEEKGKMARQHEERRKVVLERREAKRQEKIRKTKEKLQKENEIQTPDTKKPKRPSYEEKRQKLLERRKQLKTEEDGKPWEKIEEVKEEIVCSRSEQMPDVST